MAELGRKTPHHLPRPLSQQRKHEACTGGLSLPELGMPGSHSSSLASGSSLAMGGANEGARTPGMAATLSS